MTPDDAISSTQWIAVLTLLLMLLVPVAVILAAWFKRRYAARRFSELQLTLGAYRGLITMFTLGMVLLMSFESRTGAAMEWIALAILLLWWLWRLAQRAALWLVRRRVPAPLGALLMPRVFKPSGRSEAFTDRFLARWRFATPVWMIAGPDLARRFITSADEVDSQMAELAGGRDPDSRFRVGELFCSDTTWKPAVHALIDQAGAVLLDLREFTSERAGTRYELEELLRRGALAELIVLVDAHDDLAALESEIQGIWRSVAAPDDRRQLRLITVGSGSDSEMRGLFRVAVQIAA